MRNWLVGLEILLSVGAMFGGIGLITGGLEFGAETMAKLPFGSAMLAGFALLIVNGVFPAIVAVAAVMRNRWAPEGHAAVGLTLMFWILIQVGFIGWVSWLQAAYLGLGLLIEGLAVAELLRR
jgi:hypothetical protein